MLPNDYTGEHTSEQTEEPTQNEIQNQTDISSDEMENPGEGQTGAPATIENQPSKQYSPEEGANVRLSSKVKDPIARSNLVNIGMQSFKLPSEAQQRAGFRVENPGVLINQFPQHYKTYDSAELERRRQLTQERHARKQSEEGGQE